MYKRKRRQKRPNFVQGTKNNWVGFSIVMALPMLVEALLIIAATNDVNNIALQRIDQVISQGGKEIESVLSKILREAIEDVYQAPFRLLGNFGKQQLNKLKRKLLK